MSRPKGTLNKPTSLRFENSIVDRVVKLTDKMEKSLFMRLSQAQVFRAAIEKGLDEMEKKYK